MRLNAGDLSATATNGWVTTPSQVDSYRFTGEITDFVFIEGNARVYLNGEEINPTALLTDRPENVITIRGSGVPTKYTVRVDGELYPNPSEGPLEQWDHLTVDSVTGWVTEEAHVDSYRFSGNLTDVTFQQGTAKVYLNGERVTVDEGNSKTHTITVRGKGTPTEYHLSVSGELQSEPGTLEQWDNVTSSSATGWITDMSHSDTYRFSGEITEFAFLQGEARVYINGEQIDPDDLNS